MNKYAGLTSTSHQNEMRDYPPNLKLTCGQNLESRSCCWLYRPGLPQPEHKVSKFLTMKGWHRPILPAIESRTAECEAVTLAFPPQRRTCLNINNYNNNNNNNKIPWRNTSLTAKACQQIAALTPTFPQIGLFGAKSNNNGE